MREYAYHRRVGLPSVTDNTPPTLRPPVAMTAPAKVLLLVGRPAWAYRLELALLVVAVVLIHTVGRLILLGVLADLAILAWWQPTLRAWMLRPFRRASMRRRWTLAVRHARLANHNDRVPRMVRWRPTLAGERLMVRVPPGEAVKDVEDQADTIAAFLRVREVRVTRWPDDAGLAEVSVVRRDPLLAAERLAWPTLHAERLSLWEPIPVGIDEDGQAVTISLFEHNALLGGEPRAGKSTALQLAIATAALDPTVRLTLFDPKQVELAPWAGRADRIVGPNLDEAIQVLRDPTHGLIAELDARYAGLLANRQRKVGPEDDLPMHLIVIDELAFYTDAPDRKLSAEFSKLMRDLASRAPAAAMPVVAATHKPSSDVVPTYLRDLFGFRWAFRCSTPQASDTILGQGWATAGYSAATIDAAYRGIGFLLHEGGLPVRLRTFYLSDHDLTSLAVRAEALRRPAPEIATKEIAR